MAWVNASWSWKRSWIGAWMVCDHSSDPSGTATSCADTRSSLPARRSEPVTTASTCTWRANAGRSGPLGVAGPADRLDRTITDSRPDSAAETASGRLKARKSVSGVRPQQAEGQHDQSRERGGRRRRHRHRDGVGRRPCAQRLRKQPPPSAGRCAGSLARACRTACSNSGGAVPGASAGGSSYATACRMSTSDGASKAARPVEHLVDDRAGREDVRAMVHRLAADLFRRQVARRADDQAAAASGGCRRLRPGPTSRARPKSSSFTPWRVRKMLAGFRSRWIRPRSCTAASVSTTVSAMARGFVKGQGTAREAIGQRLAVEQLHHEVVHAVLMPDVVDGADVRVVQRGDGARLALEPARGGPGPPRPRWAGP